MPRRIFQRGPTGWELKLARLEDAFGYGHGSGRVPGTTLVRVLLSEEQGGGVGWCLGMGRLNMPKCFFYSKSINGCLQKARNAVVKGKIEPPTIPLIG